MSVGWSVGPLQCNYAPLPPCGDPVSRRLWWLLVRAFASQLASVRCLTRLLRKIRAVLGNGLKCWPKFVPRTSGLVPWCLLPLELHRRSGLRGRSVCLIFHQLLRIVTRRVSGLVHGCTLSQARRLAQDSPRPGDVVGSWRAWRLSLSAMSWIAWRLAAAISYSNPGTLSGIAHLPAAAACLA